MIFFLSKNDDYKEFIKLTFDDISEDFALYYKNYKSLLATMLNFNLEKIKIYYNFKDRDIQYNLSLLISYLKEIKIEISKGIGKNDGEISSGKAIIYEDEKHYYEKIMIKIDTNLIEFQGIII